MNINIIENIDLKEDVEILDRARFDLKPVEKIIRTNYIVHCDACNKDISKKNSEKHFYTKSHIKRQAKFEQELIDAHLSSDESEEN